MRVFGSSSTLPTSSRWAALARKGEQIVQLSFEGRYVANVPEGASLRYPTWERIRLPE